MKKLITLIVALMISLILVNFQCNENIVEPPPEPPKPPGYQEDIPWPSLADSPWPMNHHDPQSTGRSNYVGPLMGQVSWSLASNYIQASSSFLNDSLICFSETGKLKQINKEGLVKWGYELNSQLFTTPLISKDNTIYIANSEDKSSLFAINPDGTEKWQNQLSGIVTSSLLNIDLIGNLYIVSDFSLYCISKEGNTLWQIYDQRINPGGGGMSFSPDGRTLYLPGLNTSILAIDVENKLVKWSFGNQTLNSVPVVDSYGIIYIIPSPENITDSSAFLQAISPSGNLKWDYKFSFSVTTRTAFYGSTCTIDKIGNIYFAYDSLYSLNYEGKINWIASLNGISDAPLVCDINSNVYVSTQLSSERIVYLSKYNNEGNFIWQIDLTNIGGVGSSPAIGKDNNLIFIPWRGFILYYIN